VTDIAGSTVPVQQESVQFNNPVSESSLSSIGAIANYLLNILAPVGTIWASCLYDNGDGTYTQNSFQAQIDFPTPATWVLADGRCVIGSEFQALTGLTNVPDLRGITVRGSNYGGSLAGTRTDGFENPDGTLPIGQFTASRFQSHTHPILLTNLSPAYGGGGIGSANTGSNPVPSGSLPIEASYEGGNDTAPSNVTVNYFIRIN
jgi:hypothetical protein